MKKSFFVILLCVFSMSTQAADTLFVKETRIPVLIERKDNVLIYMRIDAHTSTVLNDISLRLGKSVRLSDIESLKLYYAGTEAFQDIKKNRFAPVDYISSHTPGGTLAANSSYSILKSQLRQPKQFVTFYINQIVSGT